MKNIIYFIIEKTKKERQLQSFFCYTQTQKSFKHLNQVIFMVKVIFKMIKPALF